MSNTDFVPRRKKQRKISLQVDIFTRDGVVDEVKQSAHLGNQQMLHVSDSIYGCTGTAYNDDTSCTFHLYSFGIVVPKAGIGAGKHEVDSPPFDALLFLDEREKLDALTDEEKERLSHITILQLQGISCEAHTDDKPGWTPLQAAVIAILQHKGLPQPTMEGDPPPTVEGDHTDGADGVLVLGDSDHERTFEVGDPFWGFCEYKHCLDGRDLYRFTWLNVPDRILKE